MGAPITVNTANPAPIAAKSAVMVRDVGRVSQLFTLLESRILPARPCAMKFPLPFWFLPGELPGYLIIGHEVAIKSEYGTTCISTPQTETETRSARHQDSKWRAEQ